MAIVMCAMCQLWRKAVVVRAAVLDGDRFDAVPENAPSDRDPGVRRPDDGDDAKLHDGGEPAPTDDDAVDPSVAAARCRSVDGSAGPPSNAVRHARLAWSNEDHDRTRPLNGRPPEPTRTVKVGRNAPCPCGSGKEYKKCCGATVMTVAANPPSELLEFLRRYDSAVKELALGLRKLVHEEMTPCHEYIFAMRSKVVLLYGATERVAICHINVFARHVNLGFSRGTELEDSGGILRGFGKAMRHIRLTEAFDLDRPEIRAYLRQARKGAGLATRRDGAGDKVMTRVKQKSARRRATSPWG